MFSPLRGVSGLLLLCLAGCASGPVANRGRAPDWSSDTFSGPTIDRTGLFTNAPVTRSGSGTSAPVAAAVAPQVTETWIPLARWCQQNGFAQPAVATRAGGIEYTVRSSEGAFVLRSGTTIGHWQGVELHLGYAPVTMNGELLVHCLDLRKTLLPLLARETLDPQPGACVVVLDPGHGGHDSGTKSILTDTYEKELTLDWARRVAGLLSQAGCKVVLTHEGDTDLSLSNRVVFAGAHHGSVFLSLHFNAASPGGTQSGIETYCLTPSGMPSSFNRGYDDDPGLVFPNNQFDRFNLNLACHVQEALLRQGGVRDRGVRRARFLSVLRAQPRPAILIEGGYLSNPSEAERIGTPEYRQRLAQAVASAVQDWFRQEGFVLGQSGSAATAGGAGGP